MFSSRAQGRHWLFGAWQARGLRGLVESVGARFVIADDELSASQARVLERLVGFPWWTGRS